ncbi:MFS transporter [Actinophytocola sp.]|uniref:MFS transporter n=1 Tax=Actinophytocola sp. TaxID=1872138 RepID=UPI0025C162EC|nr:MFS transporter [Actinophytocola sp.]
MDFRRVWLADAISQLGTRMTFLAAPLVAVLSLHASAFEVALVRAFESLGALLFGLLAGAWVDRLRCRPVLLVTDLGRFLVLLSIPAAALVGVLSLGHLYVVMFVVGSLSIWFDIAHQSYLPRLLPADQLVSANAKLSANTSVAALAGASGGGFLVQLLTAPLVFTADALSFLWSAAWIRSIRHREPGPPKRPDRHLGREILEGLRFVVRQPLLRAIAGNTATFVLWQSAHSAVTVVFLVREIGLSAGAIGLLGTIGLVGALLSAAASGRLTARFGQARALVAAAVALGPGYVVSAFTTPGWGLVWFVASTAIASFGIVLLGVTEMTCRQLVCPPELLGRVNATMEFTMWAVMPVGAILGGGLATWLGLRETILVAGVGACFAALWLVFSPMRRLRDFPAA